MVLARNRNVGAGTPRLLDACLKDASLHVVDDAQIRHRHLDPLLSVAQPITALALLAFGIRAAAAGVLLLAGRQSGSANLTIRAEIPKVVQGRLAVFSKQGLARGIPTSGDSFNEKLLYLDPMRRRSAGRLDAPTRLLETSPSDFGAAIVIVNHLRTGSTLLQENLPRPKAMPVEVITQDLVAAATDCGPAA